MIRVNGKNYKWSATKFLTNLMLLVGSVECVWTILSLTVLTGSLKYYNLFYVIFELVK